jgi:hypothetical protein
MTKKNEKAPVKLVYPDALYERDADGKAKWLFYKEEKDAKYAAAIALQKADLSNLTYPVGEVTTPGTYHAVEFDNKELFKVFCP